MLPLETVFWPNETREPHFEVLREEGEARPEEAKMAGLIIDSRTAPFDPAAWVDDSREAAQELARRRVEGREVVEAENARPAGVVGLMEARQAGVEATPRRQAAAG